MANGDAQAAFLSATLAAAQLKGRRIRTLATTAAARSPLLPDVRSKLAEAGSTFGHPGRAETERLLRSEAARWAAIVKATGFKGD